MSTVATRIHTGDVVEIEIDGQSATALVLLANQDMAILDPCDGRTPVVVAMIDLDHVRVFDPATL